MVPNDSQHSKCCVPECSKRYLVNAVVFHGKLHLRTVLQLHNLTLPVNLLLQRFHNDLLFLYLWLWRCPQIICNVIKSNKILNYCSVPAFYLECLTKVICWQSDHAQVVNKAKEWKCLEEYSITSRSLFSLFVYSNKTHVK